LVRDALPSALYLRPKPTAERGGFSQATLWRGVDEGRITPPSYVAPKTPLFHVPTFDADMVKLRAKPSECEAGRRAAKLTEARQQARARRETSET
jgi:hypothetical protein